MARQAGIIQESQTAAGSVDEVRLELIGGRFCVVMRPATISSWDLAAFRRGMLACSFLDPGCPVPLALWSFAFVGSLGLMEVNFNRRALEPGTRLPSAAALEREGFLFLLYQGDTLVETCEGRPPRNAARRFAATLRRQAAVHYTPADYQRWLTALSAFTVAEIFALGEGRGRQPFAGQPAPVDIYENPDFHYAKAFQPVGRQ